jgi:hypothetical protein
MYKCCLSNPDKLVIAANDVNQFESKESVSDENLMMNKENKRF